MISPALTCGLFSHRRFRSQQTEVKCERNKQSDSKCETRPQVIPNRTACRTRIIMVVQLGSEPPVVQVRRAS
jgi:hypothetical protein